MGPITMATGGMITGYSNQLGAITSVAKGILCLPQLLSPENLKNLTAGILGELSRSAGEIVGGLLMMISSTITNTINAITGAISAELAVINSFLQDIANSIAMIIGVISSLDDIVKGTIAFLLDGQNCQFAAAELARCLVGEIIGDITRKQAMEMNKSLDKYNEKVFNITQKIAGPDTTINRFIGKSQMFANKAIIQQSL